jgi:AraC-like DNA-binding protein/TolB-like protein
MNGDNTSQQEFLAKITAITEANLHNEQFGVNELARALGMSRITLHRKITLTAGVSVSHFIMQARLKKAFELLKQHNSTVSEVGYQCGFNSPAYFSKCFHDYFGFPPVEAKNHETPGIAEKTKTETSGLKPAGKKNWLKVAFPVAIALIAIIITSEVFIFRSFSKEKESTGNTIAIVPFINDSGEEFAKYTAWMGIEIGNKISKIENMLVVPQSTAENYRDSKKSKHKIARELNVDYLLYGHTIKTGNKIILNVELLEAKTDNSIFNEMYERDLDETEETELNRIFEICSDVVFKISEVLQTNLTKEEKEQITKKSTKNMTALQVYQQAIYHLELARLHEITDIPLSNEEHNKAKKLFEEAVKIDSTFADAYTLLGHIYINHLPYYADIYLADRYLDTGKIYLDKALYFDKLNKLAAGFLRQYYIQKGMLDEADKLLPLMDKKVKFYGYFMGKLSEYCDLNERFHVAEAYLNYLETKPPDVPVRNYMSERAFWNYLSMGFPVRASELSEEKWESARDTFQYLIRKINMEIHYGSKDSALEISNQIHFKYPSYLGNLLYRIQFCNYYGQYTQALDTLKKLEERILMVSDSIAPNFYVHGYTYLKNGMKEKADFHFKGSIKRAEDEIKLNSANARTYNSHFNLALIYAILNDKQKSIQYLGMIKKSPSITLNFVNDLKTNPMFDNVRNEPEFQKIARELEKKYYEEHEKIKKLLIRHGLEPA